MQQLKITRIITGRESDSIETYLQEIGKFKLISIEEEVELTQQIKKGDASALETLVKANLRFVFSVAKQYQNQGLSLLDLINEGNLGMIKAAEKFDETRGFKFISYAVWWIRQSIIQALALQTRTVRLPLNQAKDLREINRVSSLFKHEKERNPSPEELSELIGIKPNNITETLQVSRLPVQFDAPLTNEDGGTFLDVIDVNLLRADSQVNKESLQYELDRFLSRLTPREEYIVRKIFGYGYIEETKEAIAEEMGLKVEGVRQIKAKALNRIKEMSHKKGEILEQYL